METISLKLPEDLSGKLERVAREQGQSKSALVREALEAYLAERRTAPAGGGIKPGIVHGETDDFGYNIVKDPVHVHDFQATVSHCLGFDHEELTYRFQGRDYRLTDVFGDVVHELLV